jgi:hypothetical protein
MSSQTMKNKKTSGLLSILLASNLAMMSPAVNAQEKICILTDAGKKVCGTPNVYQLERLAAVIDRIANNSTAVANPVL